MTRRTRLALKIAAWCAAALVFLVGMAVMTLRSPWLHEKVRVAIITELERATGGTATLGAWAFNWRLLTAEFHDLTLHGTEPANAPPLLYARSARVGLKIISFWKKNVDIQSFEVVEPRINIIVAADGSTNIPAPKVRKQNGKVGLEPLLDWKIAKLAIERGVLLFAEKKTDFSLTGENLRAAFSYDFTGPRYKGELSIQPLKLNAPGLRVIDTDAFMTLALEKNRIEVSKLKLDMRRSRVEASGSVENLAAPVFGFRFNAHVAADQGAGWLRIPGVRRGLVDLDGSVRYVRSTDYEVTATVHARGLDVASDGIHVSDIRSTSTARLNPRGLELSGLTADLLGGRFRGRVDLPELHRFIADGAVESMPIQRTLTVLAPQLPPAGKTTWSGTASGHVHVEDRFGGGAFVAAGNLTLTPASGGIPVEGMVDAKYDGRSRTVTLGKSFLVTPGVRLDASGVLGSELSVRLASTNLTDLLPAINVISKSPVSSLPVQLKDGTATFDGVVSGNLNSPLIAGVVSANHFVYSGIDFDSFSGQVKLNESSIGLQDGRVARGAARAQIAGTAGLNAWKVERSSALTATATLTGMEISELLKLVGQKPIPVTGALAVSAHLSGTADNFRSGADITINRGVAYDEPFDRLQASVEYSPQTINLRQMRLTAGPAQVTGSAIFQPARPFDGAPELRDGTVQFQVTTNELAVQRLQNVKLRRPDITGLAQATLQGSAEIHTGASTTVQLTSLNGDVTTRGLQLDNRSIGNIQAKARTEGAILKVQLDSDFLNSNLTATGQWRLAPGYPGEATARFSRVSLGSVRAWLNRVNRDSDLNFDGSAEGSVSITGPALDVRGWKATAQLSKLELYPQAQGAAGGRRFTLQNDGPIALTLEKSVVTVTNAHFTGPSSNVRVTGTAQLDPKASLDLRVEGNVNLGIAQSFTTDIETDGAMTINASIHGSPDQPQINGRLEVQRGSVHFTDTTTGLSDANGTIVFSGNQATLQNFAGLVGGGAISLSGVIGYAGGDLSYRIDTTAKAVRVRYPEGASTTADAELSLRGTSQRSTVSGTVIVRRTGFNPRTDFSSILGKASEPVRTPSARVGPLSGMRFDVRIETAPDISFESSVAQDIQVEGNLRLQGTPYNPVLLGRLNITQGEINFFGTKYTINQGSITFANPVKLEPVFNVDLETRVQGIDVILTVSGPITKLNITPRSDPPLEFSQVVALLAAGSAPTSDPTLAARQTNSNQSFTQLGASTLIGQVVANPVSSRLQRFFGVSRLKIDPQLTGVENNPQARLTLEQQVSKNLTFTYITNLNTSNQQIVRVEWALSRQFSVIAVRDENGLFGIDFLYKKSFK